MPGSRAPAASGAKLQIDTVTGPISADALGVTLMHEHVLVDFIGAVRGEPDPATTRMPCSRRCCPICSRCARSAARRSSSARQPIWAAIRGSCSGCREASGVHHPVEHRLLRRGEGQARARARLHRDRGAAGRALDSRVRARHRRHGDQAGVHEDRRRRRRRCRRSMRSWCAPRRSRTARPACRSPLTPATGAAAMAELDLLEAARRAAVRVHLGARAVRARRDVPRARGAREAPGWSSTASARRASRGTSRSCSA